MTTDPAATDSGRLLLSFWDICLDNLPEGTFSRRRISSDAAKHLIEQARDDDRLRCLSSKDLLAHFGTHDLRRHEKLCQVLSEHFGITFSLKDFLLGGFPDDPYYTVAPLNIAQLDRLARMLVITCAFTLVDAKAGPDFAFAIIPETVEFHLFEADVGAESGSIAA